MGGSIWAQETTSTTNEDYVLQQARDKYAASSATQPGTTTVTTETTTTTTIETQPALVAAPAQPAAPAQTIAPVQPVQPAAPAQPATTFNLGSTTITIEVARSGDAAEQDGKPSHRYTPFVLSFVPGLSLPFGIYDTSFSAAPIGALTGSVHGVQGAGVFNIADGDVHGVQGAGVFNIVGGDVRGVQGAGVFNIAERVRGAQAAGLFNIADTVNGIQSAGIFNIADELHGIQVSGVVNVADDATGAMIGLVNIADELDGIAIGLVNIIGNGIHDISVDYQFDSGMTYATYRSGTPFLYAAFTAGQQWNDVLRNSNGMTVGTALGHRFRFLFLTADVELGMETPVDPESLNTVYQALSAIDCHDFDVSQYETLASSFNTFGTLRASFGFGNRKGFGPYVGIKADFAPSANDTVPGSMRSAFGSAAPYTVPVFGVDLDIWPKWFVGIKF
jgi:hypothetical protein